MNVITYTLLSVDLSASHLAMPIARWYILEVKSRRVVSDQDESVANLRIYKCDVVALYLRVAWIDIFPS